MKTWIALLRGINVGGRNRLPMAEFRADLTSLGLTGVKTYIQSGNVVFQSAGRSAEELAAAISTAIDKRHGFRPPVLVLGRSELESVIAENPFREAEQEPKTLHLFFLEKPAAGHDLAALEALKAPSERFHLTDSVFYLHAPDGIGRSKLASKAEKLLGVAATARNWRTVVRLSEMVK